MSRIMFPILGLLFLALPAWAQPTAKKRALLVGVSTYTKSGLADKPLPYAASDMEELARELKAAGWDVRILISKGMTNNATQANLRKELNAMLNGIDASDLVLVALSGHGQQFETEIENEEGRRVTQEEAFFCPSDGVPGEAKTLFGLTELLRTLGKKGGRNFVMVDACRDDPRRGGKGVDGNTARYVPGNTAILLSCAARQQSYETNQMFGASANRGHGIFFYNVLKGLRGEAKNGRGEVTWDRLSEYVKERVNDDAVRWFPERVIVDSSGEKIVQTPHIIGSIVGKSPVFVSYASADKPAVKDNPAMIEAEAKCRRAVKLLTVDGEKIENRREAAKLFKQAADQNHAESLAWMGYLHTVGMDVVQVDPLLVIDYFWKAGQKGYTAGWVALGFYQATGYAGIPAANRQIGLNNIKFGFDDMKRRADAGDPLCLTTLGAMYAMGVGVAQDNTVAIDWSRKAAEKGITLAVANLFYLLPPGVINITAQMLKVGSDLGDCECRALYAGLLLEGRGVTKDVDTARKLMARSAEQGSLVGTAGVATMYLKGEVVQQNMAEALRLFRKAADLGHTDSRAAVGIMLYDGVQGIQMNKEEGAKYLRLAAKQSDQYMIFLNQRNLQP